MAYDQLDPTTRRKLRELARRRRSLLLVRAVFAAVLTLLGTMAVVAVIDRLVVLSQGARIALSLSAYLAVAVVVYVVSLRYLLRLPTLARLAQLIESAEPSLREDLVSAVELAKDVDAVYDSPAFREVLQRNVAMRVSNVDTERVLPWRLVAWWAAVSTGAVVVTVALIMTPGLRYGDLLTRAMLPTADLDRVSDVRITVLSPELDEGGRVPMNADLPVRVEVTGGRFEKVVVEVVDEAGGRDDLRMRREKDMDKRFVADIAVGDRPMKFRVSAGDGRTRYYVLDPTARPEIARFSQVVQPPAYTGWDPKRVSGEDGKIDVLTGSVVDLTLSANQPIKSGRLIRELPEGEQAQPLYIDPADATVLTTSLPIEQSGAYRVELVALDTAFKNDDARRYEITARPDGLPQVELRSPEGTTGQPGDALVQLAGRAGDDVGLREVAREARVNGGEWQRELVTVDRGGRIATPIDLLPMGLREGDEVEVRLSATDLAGHKAQSSSARLVVTPDGLELASAAAAADQRKLLVAMARALEAAKQAEAHYQAAAEAGANGITQRQAQTQALIAQSALHDELERAGRAADLAVRSARAGANTDRVLRAGRALAEAEMLAGVSPVVVGQPEALAKAKRAAGEAGRLLGDAAGDLRAGVSALEMAVITQQGRLLSADLERLTDQAAQDRLVDESLAGQRLRRRAELAAAQGMALQRGLASLTRSGGLGRYQDRVDESAELLGLTLGAYEKTLGRGADTDAVLAAADLLRNRLTEADPRLWPAWVYLAKQDREQQERQPENAILDADAIGLLVEQARQQQLIDALGPVIDRLRRRAELEEARPMADNGFVALTGVAATALEQVTASSDGRPDEESPAARIARIHLAYQTIERVQTLADLRTMIVALAKAEREDAAVPRPALEHRLDWSAIEPRLGVVEQTLKQENGLKDAAQRVRDAKRSEQAKRVEQEMQVRRQFKPETTAVHEELDAIARMLGEALDAAAPALAAAREALSAQTPSLPERMGALAERAEQLAQESAESAKQAPDAPEPEVLRQVEDLAQKQLSLNAALDALSNELRREANRQDLFTEEGREAARDLDDAIAMLRPDAQEATRQLDVAQRQTTREHERPEAIANAADAQRQTAETLDQLAEHFENAQQKSAQAEQSRQALRDAEQELGIAEQLQQQYERMKRLSELAQLSDEQRLAQLEKQLRQDQPMQRELDRVADDLAEQARQRLEDAARREQALANELAKRDTEQQRAIDPTEEAIDELAQKAGRLERDRAAPLSEQAKRGAPEARQDIDRSREALKRAESQANADPQQAQAQGEAQEQRERAQALAESTREAADQLGQASEDAKAAAEAARQRHQAARKAADAASREGVAAPEAAREVIEAARQVERAEAVREEAADVARRAEDLARRAESLNDKASAQGEQAQAQRQQGAAEQAEHAQQAGQAAEELNRAARHEERLSDPARAEQLAQAADQTRDLAQQALPEARERIGEPGPLEQAEQAAREAEQALRDQARNIEEARQTPSEPQGQEASGEASGEQAGENAGEQQQGSAGEQQQGDAGDAQDEGEQRGGEPQSQADPSSGEQSGVGEGGAEPASEQGQTQGESQGQEGQPDRAGQGEQGTSSEQSGEGQGQQGQGEGKRQGQHQGQGQGEGQSPGQGQGQGQTDPSQGADPAAAQDPGLLPGPLPQAVARELARELDQLDEKLFGHAAPGSQSTPQPGQGQQTGERQPQQGDAQPGQGQESQGEGQSQGESQGQSQSQSQGQGQSQSQGQGQAQGQGQGQGQSQGQPAPGSRPIDAAAQAQAQAIRDARNAQPGSQPGQQPGNNAGQPQPGMAQGQQSGQQNGEGNGNLGDSQFNPGSLAEAQNDGRRNWGDLPPRIIEDLSRGERQRAPAEYLDQVDAYFRAIARRSREQSDE